MGKNKGPQLFPGYGPNSGLTSGASPFSFPKAVAYSFFRSVEISAAWRIGSDEPLHLLRYGGGLVGHLGSRWITNLRATECMQH